MQLEITNTDENFAPITGLTDIIARLESPVDELRREIAKKLIELKYLPPGSSPQLVRIRDKCSTSAGKILNNGTTLSQNGIYSVYDGKTLCIQILDEEENLAEKFMPGTENLSGQNSMNISRQNSPYSLLDKPPGYFPYVYDNNHYVDITNTKMRKFYSNDGVKVDTVDSEKSQVSSRGEDVTILKARSEDDYETKKNNKNDGITCTDKKNSNSSDVNNDSDSFNRNLDTFRSNKINPVNEHDQPEKSNVIINNNTIYNSNSSGTNNSHNNSNSHSQSYTEMITARNVSAVLLQIQVWNRRAFTVGTRIEVLIRQDEPLKSVAKKLAYYFNIPLPFLRILFVPGTSEINLCDLPLNCPTKYSTRAWFDGSLETRKLSDLCEMKLYDGDLLLLQNIREPLRELTETEKKSIEKKSQAPSYYDYPSTSARNYDSNTLKSNSNFDNSTYSTVLQFGARTKKKENGVFIKTQKERKRQSDKEEEEKRVREEAETLTLTQDPSVILPDSPVSPSPSTDTPPIPIPAPSGKREITILPPSDLDLMTVLQSDKSGLSGDFEEGADLDPPLGTDDDAVKMGLDLLSDLN